MRSILQTRRRRPIATNSHHYVKLRTSCAVVGPLDPHRTYDYCTLTGMLTVCSPPLIRHSEVAIVIAAGALVDRIETFRLSFHTNKRNYRSSNITQLKSLT